MTDPTRALLAAQDGDPVAFERFIRLTTRDVTRFCAYLGDPDHAEDLVQETYLRALRSLHTYRASGDGIGWVMSIARRVCADSIADRQRARRTEISRRPDVDGFGDVELALLVEELPEDQRQAFVLTQVLGYRYDEAAVVAGCPVGTIRSRVFRARGALAEALSWQARRTG
jgi:RNA polymerase sigma-70 factor (ECF subfamily)